MSIAVRDAPPGGAAPVAPQAWRRRLQPPGDGRGGWLVTLFVVLVAGGLRFLRLDEPAGRIFDEIYYVCDAQNLLRYGVEHDTIDGNPDCVPEGGGAFIAHPPLGKWLIAIGLRLFGVDEFGWRFSAALAGTLTVLLVVRVGRRLTGSTLLGALAGLLLALDGLHFVQSRIAMLDVFLTLWTTAAFTCLVLDRDTVRRRLARLSDDDLRGTGPRLWRRPWLLAAGLSLGAGVATKWSALYFLAVLGLLAFAWEVGARRTAGVRTPVRSTLRSSSVLLVAALIVLPAVTYLLSWAGWFASDLGWDRFWARDNAPEGLLPDGLRSWWHYHVAIFEFHDNLRSRHTYQSHVAGWLLLARPVAYYYPHGLVQGQLGCEAAQCSREVLAIGTPAIWWAGIPLVLALLWLWLARRDWRAAAVLVPLAAGILPWIRDDLDGRTMFLFYALPSVPFLCLGLALVAGWVVGGPGASRERRTAGAAAVGCYLALVVVNFAYLYPVLAAQTLPYAEWHRRMWFSSWI